MASVVCDTALAAWWNEDWQFRKEITLDTSATGADVAGAVTEVPVLVRLSLGNFEFFGDAQPDGSDVRFVAGDDKTPLKFHIEKWDASSQIALVWVRVPQITAGANTDRIFMYYGNPEAPAASDPNATYDAQQALVLHFGESDGQPTDSTANRVNVSVSTAERNPASFIGGGMRFTGEQSMTVPPAPALRFVPERGLTMSAWLRLPQPQSGAYIAELRDGSAELALGVSGLKLFGRWAGAAGTVTVTQSDELTPDTWHHVALRAAGGRLDLLVDGREVGSGEAQFTEVAGTLTIGASGAGGGFLVGELDELQLSTTGRATDWLKVAASSESPFGKLVVYGGDAQQEGGHQSYFGTIAKNLTVDGWVVIAICGVMLAIAIALMIAKAIFLTRVERGNAAFLRDFARLKGDPTQLDVPTENGEDEELLTGTPAMTALVGDKGKYGLSTVYRLYHSGCAELSKRVAGQAAGARPARILSSQSIEAIRASLDASLTRIQSRLSSKMVFLTIAISGGPFLGLLGTVIGVMITFAAIAASGDVNVNAIAPGTAAALAATVAGLAVAIPALFGYNWLNTRIKAISADNRVFIDEFVTRVAEEYS
jgi:biopolymer transport protein ExbB